MNRLRSNIVRLAIILVVGLGFSFSFIQPLQAEKTSTAFADWLRTKAKAKDGVDLQKELNNLRDSKSHFDKVVKEASQIVKQNDKAFDFSFSEAVASNHFYQLLLIEWQNFQTGNAMTAVSMQQPSKILPSGNDYAPQLHRDSIADRMAVLRSWSAPLFGDIYFDCVDSLTPMVNSIAIGAP